MPIRGTVALAALLATAPAWAAEPVAVANQVYVEREIDSARVLEPADSLRPGDRLVYVVSWKAATARAERFTIVNPLPRAVAYQRSANGAEEVSVDGGRSWGKLGELRLRDGARWRDASPEDVTHVRWRVPARLAVAGSGKLTWSGIVR
ncbi:MAG: hypothetical protein LC648_06960 [Novosphingobium sp.]|nr:hypothetical protein [Novosphingobium sp.]